MGNTAGKHQSATANRPTKKNVHWKSAEPPSPPGKPILVHTTTADHNSDGATAIDVVTLKWDRPRTDGGSPLYGYYVEHRRTGSSQWVSSTPALILYPEVVLTGLEPGWRYQFRVTAENACGPSEYSELSDPLTVALLRNVGSNVATTSTSSSTSTVAPQFVVELPITSTVIENEKVEFRVSVAGQPQPQVNWFKDGFEVFSSRRTKIVTEAGQSTLIIHQTALTDEGEIKCTATNRGGHAVTRGSLHIEAPPKIRLPRQYEDGLLIEADEVVRLKVGLAGRPAPMVVWCHNGEMIRNETGAAAATAHFDVQTTEKNSTLRISRSQRSDRGEYNLRAINKLGDDVVSFLVTVTDRPSRPGQVQVTAKLGQSVQLAWMAPQDDGGCKIGNYVVEYYRVGWNVWLKAVTTRQLSATLSDLIEGSEYKFRVKAESPYGMSEPGEESASLFVPDVKRGILDVETAKAARSTESFEITQSAEPTTATSRIPVLATKGATKPQAPKPPAPTAGQASSLPRAARPAAANGSALKRQQQTAPKLYDSDTIAREMSYGSASTSDAAEATATAKLRSDLQRYDQQQQQKQLKEIQYNETASKLKKIPTTEVTPKNLMVNSKQVESNANSELVLVLYDNKKSGQSDQSPNDPEFDSLVPPQLSHSTPELGHEHEPIAPRLRRCVSSTEMLYEKAMQRFYKAVEQEEDAALHKQQSRAASQQRQRSESIEPSHPVVAHQLPVSSRRLGSFGEADLLERRNSLRKRVSTESLTLPAKLKDLKFIEDEPVQPTPGPAEVSADSVSIVSEDRDLKSEIREAQRKLSDQRRYEQQQYDEQMTPSSSVEYEDDYTESTASSAESIVSVDSMEKFKSQMRSISKERSTDMDTYNPMMSSRTVAQASNVRTIRRDSAGAAASEDSQPLDKFDSDEMIRRSLESTEPEELLSEEEIEAQTTARDRERALSPYRTPAPDQSSIALTRPLPMPSPDFVPKPILKRPSIDEQQSKEAEKEKENGKKKEKEKEKEMEKAKEREKKREKEKDIEMEKAKQKEQEKETEKEKEKEKEKPKSKLKAPMKLVVKAPDSTTDSTEPTEPTVTDAFAEPTDENDREKAVKKGLGLLKMFKKAPAPIVSTTDPNAAPVEVAASTGLMSKLSAAAQQRKKAAAERRQNSIEENKVAVDHYSGIVSAANEHRRPTTPIYLSVDELKRQADKDAAASAAAAAAAEANSSTDNLSQRSASQTSSRRASFKPPMRTQASLDREASVERLKESEAKRSLFACKLSKDPKKLAQEAAAKKAADARAAAEAPQFRRSMSIDDEPPPLTWTPAAKVEEQIRSSRNASGMRKQSGTGNGSRDPSQTRQRRSTSRQRQPSQSKSPSGRNRRIHVARIGIGDDGPPTESTAAAAQRSQTPEQLLDEAELNVRSTVAYVMDLSLLSVAGWLYVFGNVWLVLPILALLVYRQLSAAVADKIPKWMKRKRSGETKKAADVEAGEAEAKLEDAEED